MNFEQTLDTAGASGTSTPNKESLSGKDGTSKRNVNYTSTALAEIRKSLQTFKKDEHSKDTDLELEVPIKFEQTLKRFTDFKFEIEL